MTPVLMNQAFELLALADMIAGTSLTGSLLCLYSNNVAFNPDTTVIGDLVECTFAGYTPGGEALVFADPSVSDDGFVESAAAQIVFRATDAVTPETARGYFITNAGGDLLGAGSVLGEIDDHFVSFLASSAAFSRISAKVLLPTPGRARI